MKLVCEIIEDLLPLYADDVCSDQSKQVVTEHLRECEKCREKIESTVALPVPHVEPDSPAADRALKQGFKKIRSRWWSCILMIFALIPIAFLGWNEYSAQGLSYSNPDEIVLGNAFMDCLVEGNYEKAYHYFDIKELKQAWLQDWFDEEKLANMEADGLAKFCELGAKLEALGGIDNYEYLGISVHAYETDGTEVHRIVYRIQFAGKGIIVDLDVSNDGIEGFHGGGSFVDDPLAQFSIWSEYLWQDYAGCYYDPERKEYVYYDQE